MTNNTVVTPVEIVNRIHAANFKRFEKRLKLNDAVRNGINMYEVRMQLDAAKMGSAAMSAAVHE